MTEPGMGSDLKAVRTTARRDGDHYVIDGQKTFISNGQNAGLVIVVAKTDPAAGRKGISLICVEEGTPGFSRGRNLEKIGLHAQDTSELFFDGVRVPVGNLLGEENKGFSYLIRNLPQERLVIAVRAATGMEVMLERTVAYAKERQAFGQSVIDFQHNRFKLAEAKAQAAMFRVFADHCLALHLRGELTVELAAAAKLLGAEMQNRLVRRLPADPWRLRLHGGVRDRPGLGGCARRAHLWRVERDHEGDHRPHAVSGRAAGERRTPREAFADACRSRRAALALPLRRARGAARPACAQERFPSRPITVLVPFPPGGATDVQMRAMAEAATRAFGQTVIVENKPGAGSTLGASTVARAPPDGYLVTQMTLPCLRLPWMQSHALRPAHGLHADHPPHRLPVRRGGAGGRAVPDVAGPGRGRAAAAGPGARSATPAPTARRT